MTKYSYPLVSIVVAIYNVKNYVQQCIESITHQSYQNLEIILIDDGSTDGSEKIVDSFAKQDARCIAIHQENGGPSRTRNRGIEIAQGDFIAFVDGDDYLAPDFVSYMLKLQTYRNSDLVISRNCFTTTNHMQVENDKITVLKPSDAVALLFSPAVELGAWDKLYRLNFLRTNKIQFINDFSAGEGLQFITNAANQANSVTEGLRKVYYYRTDNLSSATSKPDIERQGIGALKTISYIKSHLMIDSPKVKEELAWREWSTYGYCLRQIIKLNERKTYKDLYRSCIQHRRSGAWQQLIRKNISLKQRLIALATAISPVLLADISIKYK